MYKVQRRERHRSLHSGYYFTTENMAEENITIPLFGSLSFPFSAMVSKVIELLRLQALKKNQGLNLY